MKERYELLVDEYTSTFCANYHLEPYNRRMWLSGVGTSAEISDYIINFNDIRYCVDNHLPWDDFISWYEAGEAILRLNTLLESHSSTTRLSQPPLSVWCKKTHQTINNTIKEWSEHISRMEEMSARFVQDIEEYVKNTNQF